MSTITECVTTIRHMAEADRSLLNATVDRALLAVVLDAAERTEKAEQQAVALHHATLRFVDLAFVDPGADVPVPWKDRAEHSEALAKEIEGLAMGQAYQIVGQLFAALDDPQYRPSPADEEKVLNYLAAGSYQESFLPWMGTDTKGD